MIETLGQRRQDLYRSPDVNQIGGVCAADSDCANQLNAQLGDLTAKGWHVEGADPFVVVSAQLEDFDGDTPETSVAVTVVAVIQRAPNSGHIVDSTGAVVADVEPDTPEDFNAQGRFLLGQAGVVGDEWRIVSQESLTAVPV